MSTIIHSRQTTRPGVLLNLFAFALGALFLVGAKVPTWDAELISIGINGEAGDGTSEIRAGAVSADGRFVVFSSLANNLVSKDVSGWHVYLRDRDTQSTTLITDNGSEGTIYGSSMEGSAVISGDGRYVAFQSTNGTLVADDTNGSSDIFVFNRETESIERVSVSSDGSEAAPCSCGWPDTCNGCELYWLNSQPAISPDGRYVSFTSYSYNFVDGDQQDTPDVFVHDREKGITSIVSRAADGNLGNAASSEPAASGECEFLAFTSKANNLVVEDYNDQQDVFVWCRETNSLTRISVSSTGLEGNSTSTDCVITSDGNLVAFSSGATTLASPDTNGFIYDIFLHDRAQGTTRIVSSGLASGGQRPAISGNGSHVSFTSGTDDIYLYDITTGQRQLINSSMQFSALNENGSVIVMSGYGSLVSSDTNSDKDVYLVNLDGSEPPGEAEICNDGFDNDSDGLTDCLDKLDCRQDPACKTTGGGGGGGSGGGGGKNR
jgi:Tol biopolymer transport system component